MCISVQFSSVQSLSRVQLFETPWTAACQASLFITSSRSPPKPMSIESVMPSSHLNFCPPLLLLPPIPPGIRVFSNESTLPMRWPKYCSFSFSIVELFQTLQDDAVMVLHSICQQIWKTQQWPQDWKRLIFIPIPKKGNIKECPNYRTIALLSHTSKFSSV